jgi:hypothetical protein
VSVDLFFLKPFWASINALRSNKKVLIYYTLIFLVFWKIPIKYYKYELLVPVEGSQSNLDFVSSQNLQEGGKPQCFSTERMCIHLHTPGHATICTNSLMCQLFHLTSNSLFNCRTLHIRFCIINYFHEGIKASDSLGHEAWTKLLFFSASKWHI